MNASLNSLNISSHKLVPLASMPLTWRHVWIVFVASLGQLVGTGVATLVGVVIPLLNIISRPELSSPVQGIIGCADLLGIVVGSVVFGRLSDRYGYILFFRLCPAIMVVGGVASVFLTSVPWLVACLFIIGFGIGGEYSLDSDYISELLPVKWRSTMIGVAKAASAVGNIAVAGICWVIVASWHSAAAWPRLMWIVVAIGVLMLICRIWFWQSPQWLLQRGRVKEAEVMARKFLGKDVEVALPSHNASAQKKSQTVSLWKFLKENFSRVILSGIPWACEGLGVYGIGVFLPVLVMSLGLGLSGDATSPIGHVASSVEVTFWISCLILPGFILGIWMVRRKTYVPRLQTIGFIVCCVALIVLLFANKMNWAAWISILAFMVFELFLNMGPHLVTYLLPPMIYPVEDRGQGTGIAAALGKIGAVLAVFFIPVLLRHGGVTAVLAVSAAVNAIGAIVTAIYARKVLKK